MKRRFAVIMAALLIAAMAGCSQSGTSSTAEQSTAQSSADSSVAESAESEISEAESSAVSEEASIESSDEKSDTSVAESSDNKSKTESSQSKTDDTSKKTDDTSKKPDNGNSGGSGNNGGSSKQTEVKATGMTLDLSSLSLTAGSGQELNAYIQWSNGNSSYNGITWSTSNSGVASVSSSGYVTAKSAGTATITASYGSFSKSCNVTVKAAQVSQPSGGGSNGNTGNDGSNNGGSGNGSSGNGGSTSKPSGGGNGSSGNGSTGNGGSTSKPSGGGSGNTETTPTVKDNSPQLTKAWLEANCNKVIASNGTVVYEIPQFVQYLNEYRGKEGQKSVTWQGYARAYSDFIKELKEYKANNPMLFKIDFTPESTPYPDCFDAKGNIIATEAIFNKNYKNASNNMVEEAAHGQPHQYRSSYHGTFDQNMTIKEIMEYTKVYADEHYDGLMSRSLHEIYIVGCFRGASFTLVMS